MKDILKRLIPDSLRSKSSLAIIVMAAALVELTSAVQLFYAKKGIQDEVEHRAESELRAKSLEIQNVMNVVKVAVENMAWAVEQRLAQPDSMVAITQKLLADNEYIVGSAVAFEPYYYKSKGRQFSPYTYKHEGTMTSKQLGTDQYDYHNMEWYTAPMQSGQGHWSEPYFDEGGGEMMMSTYSMPIHDATGRSVAVFTADVSLDWLSQLINARRIYPSSYNILLSRTGQIMACPVESLVMRQTIAQVTADMKDTTIRHINQQMMAGKSGQATIRNSKGDKNYVFYAQMDGTTGWSMAVVCSHREIFHGLRWMAINIFVLMLLGLVPMGFIIWRAARNAKRLQTVNAEKERIASELHIASEIQKAMLPKTFPPYPDCDKIEIFGKLTPAKAVGGDLYDFYIRDEKLFYCIGDVSGKGVPASLVMAVTRALFRTITTHESQPERIVSRLSDTIAEDNEMNMFVTLFVGVIDLNTGCMSYCNAGHDAPLLISKDGQHIGLLPVDSNIPAGIMQGWEFSRQETIINDGSTIFLYTDGLTEAENSIHAQFGDQRVLDTAQAAFAHEQPRPRLFVEKMTDAVQAFVGQAEQSDDLTMMAILYDRKNQKVEGQEPSIQRALTLPNDIATIPQLHDFIDTVAAEAHLDDSLAMSLNLAIEEAVVNVMNYAYPQDTMGTVNVVASVVGDWLQFVISDTGQPFDPTQQADADITSSAEKRPIGGLGIFLVRQIMDTVNYKRSDGKNILTLRKKKQNNTDYDF